jgi:histone demethylase JARID1
LLTAAASDNQDGQVARSSSGALKERELEQRQDLIRRHKDFNDHYCKIDEPGVESGPRCELGFEKENNSVADEEYQCSFCRAHHYLDFNAIRLRR